MKRLAFVCTLALAAVTLAYAAVDKSAIKEMETLSDRCKSLAIGISKGADAVEKTYVQVEKVLDQWRAKDRVGDAEKKIFKAHMGTILKNTKELEDKIKELHDLTSRLERLSDKIAR